MFLYKFYMLLFSMKIAVCNCHSEINKSSFQAAKTQYTITKTGRLPICINENSGLTSAWQENYYWTHNDGGGNTELYMIDQRGYIFDTLFVKDSQNIDWEELTKDDQGHIYIGDFGNNSQARQDLCIYKHKNNNTEKITFRYADQTEFPAQKRVFDCEAFFWYKGNLYLFSKDWSNKHQTKLYVIPDKAGDYSISPKDSIFLKSPVTAADISPDGKEFALLSYGKIFTFEISGDKIDFSKPKSCIKIGRAQMEALNYTSNTDFIMTNEQRKIYTVVRNK
ncbi:hypothetical protein [Emticicia agri]|uniref:T9SS C-terminal target domain-containing protein n=1 Tax=Emticicia agri TaxID=2492393 RepID=A0A4V1ZDE2_9BACT|nr:hypothetical protein [Emticicia agri]RYU95850.1 hypothetical protein EWM59_09500 [Emticicia agri]